MDNQEKLKLQIISKLKYTIISLPNSRDYQRIFTVICSIRDVLNEGKLLFSPRLHLVVISDGGKRPC